MTESQLRRLVYVWQQRLGLTHWTIIVKIGMTDHGDDEGDETDTFARIYRHQRYDDASLEVSSWVLGRAPVPDVLEAAMLTDEFVERKLVHELLHLVTRDLANIVEEDLDGFVHRDAADLLAKAWNRAEERAIDNLARALVAAWP